MKSSRHFKRLAKSSGARALAMLAVILLALEPCVFAFTQVVSKYPTGSPTITSVDMGGGNLLYRGGVFNFNSAKSASDGDAYAEIREGACVPEGTSYTFISGTEGWSGVPVTNMNYMFDSTIGGGSIKSVFAKRNASASYTWQKTFFYDCGQPTTVSFSLKYTRGVWTSPGATNNFSVTLTKPDATSVTLISSTSITATSLTNVNGTIAASDLAQVGTYTLKVTGTLSTANITGAKVEVAFDDINLSKTPQSSYTSFQHDVEFTVSGTPVSSLGSNQYLLDIRARKPAGDSESTYIQVWNGTAWNTRYTVTSTAWTTFNTYYLTTAEYNGGNVRVRYIDATTASDTSQGGVDVEYQRVTVDQGACVDSVTDSAADCGKCHNYGGDITKPWPNLGMHNKHAQTESINDCLWCHPNNGTDSAHKNGVVTIAGTKVYRVADGNLNGAPANANYDGATKTCSNIDCHKGLTTPPWDSVEGVGGFYPNCARCHNNGTNPGDNASDLNIAYAWPNDAGGGHSKHDIAFNLDEVSCQASGSCHPDNRSQHSVVGDGKVEVKMASAYASPNKIPKYIPDTTNGTGTCANMACHGGQQTPRFNLASTNPIDVPTQCTKCHIAEQANGWGTSAGNASQWNSAISGLHRGSPPTSGKSHIADYGCTQCHKEPAKHFMTAGVSNLTDTALDTLTAADFQAGAGTVTLGSGGTRPNWTTPTTCATPAGTAGCHAEADLTYRNPATSWARRWSWDAYDTATPVNQCKNCHGHWGSWNSGVVQPHIAKGSAGGVLQLNHSDSGIDCGTMCHGQTDTANYNHGVAMTATSKDMTLNANASPVDNGDNVGCGACHSSNDGTAAQATTAGKHIFADATWVTQTNVQGPAPDCLSGSCHGANATLNKGALSSGGDFSMTRKHLAGTAVKEQCTVCHNAAAQPMNTGSALRDKIQLKNPDTGATIEIDQSLADTNATRNTSFVTFCTKCHDAGGATSTFRAGYSATNPFGTGATPKDIDSKYNSTITAVTHNYTNFNAVPQLTKARSPHGKPTINIMKGTNQTTYTDTNPVGCQSCHPSHGGSALNPLPNINGTDINTTVIQGRMMKAGYSEPGSCWGCHNSVGVKDYYGDVVGGGANWVGNQASAFAYKQRNYWSAHQVKATTMSARAGAQVTAADVDSTKVACSICHDPHGAASWNGTSGSVSYYTFSLRGTWLTSVYPEDRAGQRNGTQNATLITNTGTNVVLNSAGPRNESIAVYNKPANWGHGYGTSGGAGHDGYYLDENTLGRAGTTNTYTGYTATFPGGNGTSLPTRLSETVTNFAGLCANCHAPSTTTSGSLGAGGNMQTYLEANGVTGWSGGKIHQTVKGYATATSEVTDVVKTTGTSHNKMHVLVGTYTNTPRGLRSFTCYSPRQAFSWGVSINDSSPQVYHQFSCSKCHTPHASSLPRLMITNCLDVGTSYTSRPAKTATTNPGATQRYAYTYPTVSTVAATGTAPNTTGNGGMAGMHCHNQGKTNTATNPGWNSLTGW